jgi:hypothetical protein
VAEWANSDNVKAGDKLVTDGGFTCITGDKVVIIQEDDKGLYFECAAGKHYIDGQEDDDGSLIGLSPWEPWAEGRAL